jgi:hypothetical protein
VRARRTTTYVARCLRVGLAVLVMAIVWVAMVSLVASAQDEAPASPATKEATTLSIAFEPSSMTGIPHYLAARLVAEDGSAVVGERVSIRRVVDVFGGRKVTIGRAPTDNAGIARVPIVPREDTYRVTASFSGTDSLAASTVEDDVVFPAEAVVIPEEVPRGGIVDPQLRPLADVMPIAIGVAVVVVWIVLIGVTLFTLARVRSSRRSDERATDQGSAEVPGAGSGPQPG